MINQIVMCFKDLFMFTLMIMGYNDHEWEKHVVKAVQTRKALREHGSSPPTTPSTTPDSNTDHPQHLMTCSWSHWGHLLKVFIKILPQLFGLNCQQPYRQPDRQRNKRHLAKT